MHLFFAKNEEIKSMTASFSTHPGLEEGSKGQVFKIEENLPLLLEACNTILSDKPSFLILNAYTADLPLSHYITSFQVYWETAPDR